MAINIVKKAAGLGKLVLKKTVTQPAPVAQRLNTAPTEQVTEQVQPPAPARHKPNPDGWKNWPMASSLEELAANRNTMRPPEPRACIACGKHYPFPCDGAEDSRCITAIAIREGKHTPIQQRA